MINNAFLIIKKFSLNFLENYIFKKSLCNIFLFFNVIVFFFNLMIKNINYDFYKKTKIYRFFFLNSLFFIILFFMLNFKENMFFLMKNLYIKIGNEKLNMLSLFFSIVWVVFTFLLNIYNSFIFNFFFKNLNCFDLNYKILFFKVFVLIFFFLVLFMGFNFMNLNWLILSILSTSLGIGLSVNIQKMVNNYVSSLIILFDKNFKIGDAININGYQGVITQINNRYTMLRNLDCSEILVPNEKFLNEVVQNQSLYFSKGNLRINIQISYNNDYKHVLKILIDSLEGIERILNTPPPFSYITGFNITGIDIELSFWIIDAVRGVALVKSDVYLNILKNFKEEDIELSYYKKILKILK
ncbi:MAG: mechanosensitive ion channel family protein [Candidatus Nasuia deltocephalinicola]